MNLSRTPSRNIGLDLVRVTEAAAMTAGRWIGLGRSEETLNAATASMSNALDSLHVRGHIVIGEEGRLGVDSPLNTGSLVGSTLGPQMDIVVDPIDGTNLVVGGLPNAISVVGAAPRGTMWSPDPSAIYMEKIVVDWQAADALVPECLDAPAAWTLALVARAKGRPVRDLTVVVLDRPRHEDLIEEIRSSGARILLRTEGDAEGALEAANRGFGADVLMGIGGVPEGVIAACAVKSLGGGMLARLKPQSDAEYDSVIKAGLDVNRIMTCDDIVASDDIFFAATGITNSVLLRPVIFDGQRVETHSILLRGATGTRRFIQAEQIVREAEVVLPSPDFSSLYE